jgi:hypothetical protein
MSFLFSFLVIFHAIFKLLQCFSHFPHFSVFLDIFHVLFCVFLISFVFQFYCHLQGHRVCTCIFKVFECFSTYFTSYIVHFSFCMIFSFLTICRSDSVHFPISTFLSVSCHIPGLTVFVSHFPRFSVFLTYSRTSSVCFSFSTFFRSLDIYQVRQWAFLIFQVF